MAAKTDTRRNLDQAFDAFEDALREALESEAQRSVQAYLSTLDQNQRFRVEDSDIKVTVAGLTLSTSSSKSAAGGVRQTRRAAPSQTAKKRKGQSKPASRGARAGSARQALLNVLRSNLDKQWSTDEIREGLVAANVEVSPTNLHQLLRRVSATDEVQRVGRGLYQAQATES